MEFTYEFEVLEMHLDTFGHMNHATYLVLFEQARWEFITQRGFGLKRIQETQTGPVILEAKIRYMRELRLREKVKIVSETVEHKGKISRIRQHMLNDRDEKAAELEITFGFFDLKLRKLIDASPEWLKAIGYSEQ